MARLNSWILILLAVLSVNGLAQGLSINGYARHYTGVLLKDSFNYSIIQNTLNLDLSHSSGDMAMKANPYFYNYSDSELEFGLREAYLDIYFNTVDVRIGKQQVIWGKADGVFITDIVSPKDLREFLLPDFEEIRVGVTAIDIKYYLNAHTFELIWLPVFTPTQMPEEGSVWFPQTDFPVQPVFDYSQKDVPGSLENSEVFLKYSAITSAIDFEIMAGYAWDDDPTLHTLKTFNPQTSQLTGLTVAPEHHRLGIGGGNFSSTLGAFVVRGEAAWYNGKYFTTADPAQTDGVIQRDYLHYLVGLDYTLWEVKLSSQFIQQAIMDYDRFIDRDEFENTVTFLARRDFMRETLTLELFTYIGINSEDALIRPRLYYDLADGFEVLLGANLFSGSSGNFGQYSGNDMGYFKIKYSF